MRNSAVKRELALSWLQFFGSVLRSRYFKLDRSNVLLEISSSVGDAAKVELVPTPSQMSRCVIDCSSGNTAPIMLRLVLLAIQLLNSLSLQQELIEGPVRVSGPVSVPRGGTVDLRQVVALRLELLPATSVCKVSSLTIPKKDCAIIHPKVFDCRSYSGVISYQHLGCFAPRELAPFMISTLPVNYSDHHSIAASRAGNHFHPAQTTAAMFAVEVHVTDAHPIIRSITVDTALADPVREPGLLNVTIIFPQSLIGSSHYEVVTKWEEFLFPEAGDLKGVLNQPIPGGYVPVASLTYQSRYSELNRYAHTDYILVRLYAQWEPGLNTTRHSYYFLLPFGTNGSEVVTQGRETRLRRELLRVRQAATTPVHRGNFSQFNFTKSLVSLTRSMSPSKDNQVPTFLYTFPVFKSGSFRSAISSTDNVSFTVFSDLELTRGHVSFHPTDSNSVATFTFPYNITDVAGILIATGEVSIFSLGRDWSYPSQRTNKPLQVAEGGGAIITEHVMDLYLTASCDDGTLLRVTSQPRDGSLVYRNGTRVQEEWISFLEVSEFSLVRYYHSGSDTLYDTVHWEVWCPVAGPSYFTVTHILVAGIDDSNPSLHLPPLVTAYRGLPVLLSKAMFKPRDADSSLDDIIIRAHQGRGSFRHLSCGMPRSKCVSQYRPVVSADCLVRDSNSVDQFKVRDLEELLVWYIPDNTSMAEVVEFTVMDSHSQGPAIYSLIIVISPVPVHQSLVFSVDEIFPRVLKSRPLPMSQLRRVFITPYFLFSQASPFSSADVRYHVVVPPALGHLCHVSRVPSCTESLTTFTQLQVSHREIVYETNHISERSSDNFTFILSADLFFSSRNITHVFQLTTHSSNITISKIPLVVRTGSEEKFNSSHFRTFSDLLNTTEIIFQILRPAQFGAVSLQSQARPTVSMTSTLGTSSTFSYADVVAGNLSYNSSASRQGNLCHDEMELDVVSAVGRFRGQVPIVLMKDTETALSVLVEPRTLIGQRYFKLGKEDVSVSSPFCSEWMEFELVSTPSLGHFAVRDHLHLTEWPLLATDRISVSDIQMGKVTYRIPDTVPIHGNINDTFLFRALDPSLGSRNSVPVEREFNFTVQIQPLSVHREYTLEVELAPQLVVTWLSRQQRYGHVFTSSDILSVNTSLPFQNVLIVVEESLTGGSFLLNRTLVSSFTLADLIVGHVTFLKNAIFHDDWYEEWFVVGVYAFLPDLLWRAQVLQVKMVWAMMEMKQSRLFVTEDQRTVHISIRYVLVYLRSLKVLEFNLVYGPCGASLLIAWNVCMCLCAFVCVYLCACLHFLCMCVCKHWECLLRVSDDIVVCVCVCVVVCVCFGMSVVFCGVRGTDTDFFMKYKWFSQE